jgi:hypothetical protein
MATEAEGLAIRNLAASVAVASALPHRVLAVGYIDVYVMDFERLVRQNTIDLVKSLIRHEGSTVAAIARFEGVGKETQDWRDDVFFASLS